MSDNLLMSHESKAKVSNRRKNEVLIEEEKHFKILEQMDIEANERIERSKDELTNKIDGNSRDFGQVAGEMLVGISSDMANVSKAAMKVIKDSNHVIKVAINQMTTNQDEDRNTGIENTEKFKKQMTRIEEIGEENGSKSDKMNEKMSELLDIQKLTNKSLFTHERNFEEGKTATNQIMMKDEQLKMQIEGIVPKLTEQIQQNKSQFTDQLENIKELISEISEKKGMDKEEMSSLGSKIENFRLDIVNTSFKNLEERIGELFVKHKELNENEMLKISAVFLNSSSYNQQMLQLNNTNISELRKSFDANIVQLGPVLSFSLEGQLNRMTAAMVIAIDEMTNRIFNHIKTIIDGLKENDKVVEITEKTGKDMIKVKEDQNEIKEKINESKETLMDAKEQVIEKLMERSDMVNDVIEKQRKFT
jgi:hypothetical protein